MTKAPQNFAWAVLLGFAFAFAQRRGRSAAHSARGARGGAAQPSADQRRRFEGAGGSAGHPAVSVGVFPHPVRQRCGRGHGRRQHPARGHRRPQQPRHLRPQRRGVGPLAAHHRFWPDGQPDRQRQTAGASRSEQRAGDPRANPAGGRWGLLRGAASPIGDPRRGADRHGAAGVSGPGQRAGHQQAALRPRCQLCQGQPRGWPDSC